MERKRRFWFVVSLVVTFNLFCCLTYAKSLIYVPDDCPTIQAAIDAAFDGDTIVVREGTYTGDGNRDIDFKGKAVILRSENGPDNCIIDCQGTELDPHRGFYFHNNEDSNSVINGLTITGGFTGYEGGGIYCYQSSPAISNCIISGNSTKDDDGEIYCVGSKLTIKDCVITHNYGGGISYNSTDPNDFVTITNCTINDNSGDGIYCGSSDNMRITNCTILGNEGVGIWCRRSIIIITNCTVSRNLGGVGGGGIWIYDSNVTMNSCILWGNFSTAGGFAAEINLCSFSDDPSVLTVSYSDIAGGQAGVRVEPNCTLIWEAGNIDVDPRLTRDGHLCADSLIIDMGTELDAPIYDIDGEFRPIGDAVDIGADEFLDTDNDGLPDWWENHYFASATAVHPDDDSDQDGFNNQQEYLYDTLPNVTPVEYYVNPIDGNDIYDGLALLWDGEHGPKQTIQAAIDAAEFNQNDIVTLLEGTYTGGGINPRMRIANGNRDIDFKGKAITLRSTNPDDPVVVAGTVIDCQGTISGNHRAFRFHSGETSASIITGITMTNGYAPEERFGLCYYGCVQSAGGAIFCILASPSISKCIIRDNLTDELGGGVCCVCSSPRISNCTLSSNTARQNGHGGGIYCDYGSNPTVVNCVISGNTSEQSGGGIYCGDGSPTISNCTIVGNKAEWSGGGGIYSWSTTITISNSIVFRNSPAPGIAGVGDVQYTDVPDAWEGQSNISVDPCFVEPGYWDDNGTSYNHYDDFWVEGDYHLKSQGWRWDSKRQRWSYDEVTSRCIDAGNPGSSLENELLSVPDDPNNIWGENIRINMGAYGGTAKASMPPYDWALLTDLTNDGIVNLQDYAFQAADWLNSADYQPGDLNRDSLIDINDLALFMDDWLKQTTWAQP